MRHARLPYRLALDAERLNLLLAGVISEGRHRAPVGPTPWWVTRSATAWPVPATDHTSASDTYFLGRPPKPMIQR